MRMWSRIGFSGELQDMRGRFQRVSLKVSGGKFQSASGDCTEFLEGVLERRYRGFHGHSGNGQISGTFLGVLELHSVFRRS